MAINNYYTGLSILGSSSLVGFDYSSIANAGRKVLPGQKALADAQAAAARKTVGSTSSTQSTLSQAEVQKRFFSDKPLIDTTDPSLRGLKLTDTQKKLRALYAGLQRMGEMANYAKSDDLGAATQLGALDRQFKKYMKEVDAFLKDTKFDGLSLLEGAKIGSASAKVSAPSVKSYIQSPVLHTSSVLDVPGVTGTEKFTVRAVNGGVTTDVAIDLSLMGSAPTLDNIVTYVNSQLQASGVLVRFQAVNVAPEAASATATQPTAQWALQVNTVDVEQVEFLDDAATSVDALYVSGNSGTSLDSAGFVNKLSALGGAAPATDWSRTINTTKADKVYGSATDADGNLFVVGSSAGDLGGEINTSGANDLMLTKYDSAGRVVWQHLLGSQADAKGFAVATDSNSNVIVSGQVSGKLTGAAIGGGAGDTFVTKFDNDGQEQWTRQVAPLSTDAAFSLTVDASDNIFIAGMTDAAISGAVTAAGGRDAYVTKLDSTGAKLYDQQFGTTGSDQATGVAVDNAGNVFVSATVNGDAVVRKYADSSGQTPTWEVNLGALGTDGKTGNLVVSGGNVYVTGTTDNAALSGTIVTAHHGGTDAFVTKIADGGGTGTVSFTTYVGSTAGDAGASLTVDSATGNIYVVGTAGGSVSGQSYGGIADSFAAKLDTNGNEQWVKQFAAGYGSSATSVQFVSSGSSSLNRLGLAPGAVSPLATGTVTRDTTVRADQYFYVQVDDGPARRVTISNTDSFGYLAFKINSLLGGYGQAKMVSDGKGKHLEISALNGHRVALKAGADGYDALEGLGMKAVELYGKPDANDKQAVAKDKSVFSLGLTDSMSLSTKKVAEDAATLIKNALRVLRDAYKYSVEGPEAFEKSQKGAINPAFNAYQNSRMNNAQRALSRLVGSG